MSPVAAATGPLSGLRLAAATVALGLGSFMNILDMSIANVSLPAIAGDLGVSPTQGTWVITSYAVSEAILLPLTGWLAQRVGQVRLFVLSTLLFSLASLCCGLSPSFPLLLLARVAQGAVGAAMIPVAQILLTTVYPARQRNLAVGLFSMTTVVAPIAGPLVGGWLTDNWSWHWVFLVNVPIGALVATLAWGLLRGYETGRRALPVDYVGLVLLALGVGALQMLLDQGSERDWFESNFILGLGILSLVALACFVAWELTDEHPVVDLRLFGRRNFAIGVTCMMVGTVAFYGNVIVLPLWLQDHQGYTALWAGRVLAFGGVLAFVLGPVVGANLNRLDARAVATFGFCTFAAVAFWSARFTSDVDYWPIAIARLLMGIAISCFMVSITTINLSGLEPQRAAAASGLANFMRNLGAGIGTAGITSLWEHKAIFHHARLAESINAASPATGSYLAQLMERGLDASAALAELAQVVDTQAYVLALNAVYCIDALLMLTLVPLVWFTRPPFHLRGSGGH